VTHRLSLATLAGVPAELRPSFDPGSLRIGIVHLGLGAFHRAHQAVFTDDALAAEWGDWGIYGLSERSRTVPDQLEAQDGLYSVIERAPSHRRCRVVGSIRKVGLASDRRSGLEAWIATSRTHIVSLTVTEKGYRYDPATGRLRVDDPAIQADAAGGDPVTVVGQLVRGLQARMAEGGPLTVLSCDNIPGNGRLLRGLVDEFFTLLEPSQAAALRAWISDNVTFPSTVVDRIVPATSAADLEEARQLLGVEDRGAVVAEPFRQWVIEDDFAAGRPAWDAAGAIVTADVLPYEVAKLRILNGSHSTLAYLGAVAGHETIAEAIGEPALDRLVRRMVHDEVIPTLQPPPGIDLARYADEVLERFTNPALGHRTHQVAMDGSYKLPQRLLATARDTLASGRQPRLVALAVAGWIRYLGGLNEAGDRYDVLDPMADRLVSIATSAAPSEAVAARLLAIREVFGDDLAGAAPFRASVGAWLRRLHEDGVVRTVAHAVSEPA
jgi:fructuronate reductase